MVGKTVQHYQFLERLGAGGMGEIYRAQDTRLNRFVAIKVLSGSSAGDPERRRRFVQEAQAASALNHPNIITIHDILMDGDSQYMVMEHVQGKTLADLIPHGGLRMPQVLKLAMQMTDALQVAHSAGIIHRDLKPGNVMVTDTGLVKILDFGLAKLTEAAPATHDNDATRTMAAAPLTVEGSILGTVAYMSPEQAEGKKLDTRSDIFSLGVVLYEMITGSRAFQGETAVATLSAILRDEPKPILEVTPDVPARMAEIVSRALRKAPEERFQTMREIHTALSALKHESDSGVLYRSVVVNASQIQPPAQKASASSKTMWIGLGVAVPVLALGGFLWMRSGGEPEPEPAPVAVSLPPAEPEPQPVPEPADDTLTNDGIIDMVRAKVPLEVIYSQLRTAPKRFNLSPAEVIRLTQAGVPVAVIEGMRDPKNIATAKAPAKAAEPAKDVAKGKAPEAPPTASAPVPPPAVETPAPRPVAPAATVAAQAVVLADATPFVITLAQDIPDDAKTGQQIRFTVKNDVKVGEHVVIARGAPATGEISQQKRTFGKMQLRLLTVQAVDGRVHLIRALSAKGTKNPERPVETGAKKPDKVEAAAGTDYVAYANGDMSINVRVN